MDNKAAQPSESTPQEVNKEVPAPEQVQSKEENTAPVQETVAPSGDVKMEQEQANKDPQISQPETAVPVVEAPAAQKIEDTAPIEPEAAPTPAPVKAEPAPETAPVKTEAVVETAPEAAPVASNTPAPVPAPAPTPTPIAANSTQAPVATQQAPTATQPAPAPANPSPAPPAQAPAQSPQPVQVTPDTSSATTGVREESKTIGQQEPSAKINNTEISSQVITPSLQNSSVDIQNSSLNDSQAPSATNAQLDESSKTQNNGPVSHPSQSDTSSSNLKLFVGGLYYQTEDDVYNFFFMKYGEVIE